MEIRFLYLDLNSFFASCEQQDDESLRGRPLAVVPLMADSTSVLAASYEAKAYGIKTGTKVHEAKKLCPEIRFVKTTHGKYVSYHHRILKACDEIIPIHSVCSIDEVCFELKGSQTLVENALQLAGKLKAHIHHEVGACLTSSIGIAPNTLLAKMAADMQKPNGLTLIRKSELPGRLKGLTLRDIPGVGAKMEFRLKQKGVTTMRQLLERSENQMHQLWGSLLGARYYRLFRGEYIAMAKSAQKSMGHEHVLPPKERNFHDAPLVLQKLLNKAMIRLRKAKIMTRRFSFYIQYMDGTSYEKDFKIPETQDTSGLISLMKPDIQNFAPQKKPIKVGVSVSDFIEENEHQLSFFSNERKTQAFKAMDLINERFGKNTLVLASLLDSKTSAPPAIAFSRIPELDEFD